MKNLLFTTLLLFSILALSSTISHAQISGAKNAVSYKIVGVDYKTILLNNFYDSGNIGVGAELAYSRFLNSSLNISFPFRVAQIDYPTSEFTFRQDRFSIGGDVQLIYKFNNGYILNEKATVAPYLLAGVGVNHNNALPEGIDFQAPLGGGINWNLTDNVAIQTQAEYRFSLLEPYNNITFSAGLNIRLGEVDMEEPEPVIEAPADKDGDGIADISDDCPDTPGLAQFNGCPDRDEDGIPDKDDRCPDVAGKADFDGCPDTDGDGLADIDDDCPTKAGPLSNKGCPEENDADKDGIVDSEDECPNTPGVAAFKGCPDSDGDGVRDLDDECPKVPGLVAMNGCPDRDGDGTIDKNDRCPDEFGPASNRGCPELKEDAIEVLEFATRDVQFETGSATIKTTSYATMDQIVQILNEYPSYSVSIEGHTDSVGSDENNQALSEKRAKSCLDYFIGKGISPTRMSYAGFGETQPRADNGTKEGRALNRRVEFNVFLK